MPAKIRTFQLHNDTWQFTLPVRVGGTYKDACRWAHRRIKVEFDDRGDAYGCMFDDKNGNLCLWFHAPVRPEVIAHESLHVVFEIMRSCGNWPLTQSNQEAYTYLLEWLVGRIYSRTKSRRRNPRRKDARYQ